MLKYALLLSACLAAPASAERWNHKSSPFQAVRWKGAAPYVLYEGDWYELVSIQDRTPQKVLAFCRKQYDEKWRWRFVEDLGQVLDEMGVPPAKKVKLVLKGAAGPVTAEAEMTYRLRQRAKAAGYDQPFVAINREHAGANPRFADLAKRVRPDHYEKDELTAKEAMSDLDELEGLLEGAYSYLLREKVDYRAALDTIRAGLGKKIKKATFALQLTKFLALFGDGHSRIEMSLGAMGSRNYAPFLFGEDGGKVFAFKADRSGFVHDNPVIKGMDGVPIEKWLAAARAVVPRGSPQFVERQARRTLRYVGYLRQELGLRHRKVLKVEFADGATEAFEITGDRPRYGDWPRGRTREIGKVGYLRVDSMRSEPRYHTYLEKRMAEFKETRGLIIDVRGNGGGSRDVLRVLMAYFLTAKDPPRIANVAAYKVPPWADKPGGDGYMANRFLYTPEWSGWSGAARKAGSAHLKGFKPEWKLPKTGFSKWHFMAIDRSAAESPYTYREQVVILMDTGCYSATDIFLGAFKGIQGVTLCGTASGGGSGRTQSYGLAASGLRVRLSSMASFQPDGKLYDGNGVKPDIEVKPARGNWIGKGDVQLDKALELLK
jgi:hypothetical protein